MIFIREKEKQILVEENTELNSQLNDQSKVSAELREKLTALKTAFQKAKSNNRMLTYANDILQGAVVSWEAKKVEWDGKYQQLSNAYQSFKARLQEKNAEAQLNFGGLNILFSSYL